MSKLLTLAIFMPITLNVVKKQPYEQTTLTSPNEPVEEGVLPSMTVRVMGEIHLKERFL